MCVDKCWLTLVVALAFSLLRALGEELKVALFSTVIYITLGNESWNFLFPLHWTCNVYTRYDLIKASSLSPGSALRQKVRGLKWWARLLVRGSVRQIARISLSLLFYFKPPSLLHFDTVSSYFALQLVPPCFHVLLFFYYYYSLFSWFRFILSRLPLSIFTFFGVSSRFPVVLTIESSNRA